MTLNLWKVWKLSPLFEDVIFSLSVVVDGKKCIHLGEQLKCFFLCFFYKQITALGLLVLEIPKFSRRKPKFIMDPMHFKYFKDAQQKWKKVTF